MYEANALQAAIYTALNGVITGAVVDHIPAGTEYPYTVVGEITEASDDLHDREGSDVTATLHIWSKALGTKETNAIKKEIDAALHHADLAVTGARVWSVTREFSTTLRDRDPDTNEVLRHGVVRYRFGMEAI